MFQSQTKKRKPCVSKKARGNSFLVGARWHQLWIPKVLASAPELDQGLQTCVPETCVPEICVPEICVPDLEVTIFVFL